MALLDYCQTDVDALARLLPKMEPTINVPQALNRGRYMAAVAQMEWHGIPIDTNELSMMQHWSSIQERLIDAINPRYGVYCWSDIQGRSVGRVSYGERDPWPRLPSGAWLLTMKRLNGQMPSPGSGTNSRTAPHVWASCG